MKSNPYLKWMLAFAVIFLPHSSFAAVSGPQANKETVNLTLDDAVKTAARKNPEIKSAKFRAEAYESGVSEAQAAFFPQLNFTETFNRTTNPMWAFGAKLNQESIATTDFSPDELNDPDPTNNFSSVLSVSWPIFSGGRIYHSWKQAGLSSEAENLMLKRTRQNVIARTARAYMGLLLAIENLTVVKQSIDSAQASLNLVESRFNSGFSVKSDLLRAQVRIADLEQQRLQVKSRIKVAKAMLNAAMGMPVDTPINPITPFGKLTETKDDLDKWIKIALVNRPELNNLRLQEEISKKQVIISRSGHLPSLQAVGNYEIDSEDFGETSNNYTLGVVMQMNIFSGFGTVAKTKKANASLKQVRELIKSVELGVQVQTHEAFFTAQSSWERIKVAQTAVTQAQEALRIIKNRYKTGLLTIVSLLDAETASQQAKTILFKSLYDYKVAGIELELAAGTIDKDFK